MPRLERPTNHVGYYDSDHLEDLAADALKHSGIATAVYTNLNPITPALLARSAFLQDAGWPEPACVDSGNGYHLLYRVDLPVDDRGLLEGAVKALSRQFSDEQVELDQTVHSANQLIKLPCTWARKGDSLPDRPHRLRAYPRTPAELTVFHAKEKCKKAR